MTAALLILGALALIVGLPVLGVSFDRHFNRLPQRQIEQQKITPIAALRDGEQARVRGVVRAREAPLTSAIGEKACVGYQSSISDAGRDATPLLTRERWSSFLVTDDTGTVVVDGQIEGLLDLDAGGTDLPLRAYELLTADGVRMREVWGQRRFRFHERTLCVGDRVSVVGQPTAALDRVGGGAGGEPAARFVMRGVTYAQTVVMDDDEEVEALFARPAPVVALQTAPALRGPSRRAVAHRESTAIASLRPGELAKITGVVTAREPLVTSPASGRACVGYRLTVHRRRDGHPEENGVLVLWREAWPSFLLADDTGRAVAEGPFSILLDADDGGWTNLPASVYALLEEARVPLDGELAFRETLLAPGDRVAVVGRPALEIDPAGQGALREPPRLHVFRGSDEEPVAVVDVDEPVG
ncbi:MAG TPA: hypothetical protein VKZ18_12280 [Polyangia bacterium]|nr:hypothetical protein [Polyangia bacterium]